MSFCPYITTGIQHYIPVTPDTNLTGVLSGSEQVECMPNPFVTCGGTMMQYYTQYRGILSSGCKYYRDIINEVVDRIDDISIQVPGSNIPVVSSAAQQLNSQIKEILRIIIRRLTCFVLDEVRRILIFLIQKIVNNSLLSRFMKIVYNPDAPFGFYIIIYPVFRTHLQDKIAKFFKIKFFDLLKYRMKRRRWRIFRGNKTPEVLKSLGIDKVVNNAIGQLQDKLVAKVERAPNKIAESISTAMDRKIDEKIKKYLGKIVKYDVTNEYTNSSAYVNTNAPLSPEDLATVDKVNLPPPANIPTIEYENLYFGLYVPPYFVHVGEIDNIFFRFALKVTKTLESLVPVGSSRTDKYAQSSEKLKEIQDRKKKEKSIPDKKQKDPEEVNEEKDKEINEKYIKEQDENLLEKQETQKNYSEDSEKGVLKKLKKFLKKNKKGREKKKYSVVPAVEDLLFTDIKTIKSYNSALDIFIASTESDEIVVIPRSVVEVARKYNLLRLTGKESYSLEESGNLKIDIDDEFIVNLKSIRLFTNRNYSYYDNFIFKPFEKKLKDHGNEGSGKISYYYFASRPVYEMLAVQTNYLEDFDSSIDEVDIYFLPIFQHPYMISVLDSNVGSEKLGILYEEFLNFVETNIANVDSEIEAKELMLKPMHYWYDLYLAYKYNLDSKSDPDLAYVKHFDNIITKIEEDRPFFTTQVSRDIDEFRSLYKKGDYSQAKQKAYDIARIINHTMLPVDGKLEEQITMLIDWQVKSENTIYQMNKDMVNYIEVGHRAAERKSLENHYGNPRSTIVTNNELIELINPVLAIMAKANDLIYHYLSSVDIGVTTYAFVSLEPFSNFIDPLPDRFVYDMLSDHNMLSFLKRRGYDFSDPAVLQEFRYNFTLSVFGDLLPIRSLSISFPDIETESIELGPYRIDIPTAWNVYMPDIKIEIYDNAYRDLYNYFMRYMKMAFYKGAARPPFDIAFILDVVTMNIDFSVQNLLSYIVVPKSIDMKFIEINTNQQYDEDNVINISFSILGFIHYDSTIITINNSNTSPGGHFNFLTGSFVEYNTNRFDYFYDNVERYTEAVLMNWYGIQNAQPVYALKNEVIQSNEVTNDPYVNARKKGSFMYYYGSNIPSYKQTHRTPYRYNPYYQLPASHVYRKKDSTTPDAEEVKPTQVNVAQNNTEGNQGGSGSG